jgi:nicotinamidase-related amidase
MHVSPNNTASLMVIDMQNDFILPPPDSPPAEKMGNFGRFSVANGLDMLPELITFIENNQAKFSKIIFTRDNHPAKHCSFAEEGGPFPAHCVINHIGAALHPDIVSVAEKCKNMDVIFKGCHADVDSFGAAQYKKDAYLKRRELGNCKDNHEHTGGFYLTNDDKKLDNFPFTGVQKRDNKDKKFNTGYTDCTYKNIDKQLGGAFKVSDLFPGQTSGTHTVFVVGLAADYCVKDTAMNIAKSLTYGKFNDVRVHVKVIQPFVRYAMLPLQYVGGNQVYKNAILANTSRTNFYNTSKPKDVNHYIFQLGPELTLLSKVEAAAAKADINAVKHYADIQDDFHDFTKSNPKFYAAFLTPTMHVIQDYKTTGVKLLMNAPTLTEQAGGKTRRARRTRRGKTRRQ